MNENDRLAFMAGRGVRSGGLGAADWLAPLVAALLGQPQDLSSVGQNPLTGPGNIFDRAAGVNQPTSPGGANYPTRSYQGQGGTLASYPQSRPMVGYGTEGLGHVGINLPTNARKTMAEHPSVGEPPQKAPLRGPYTPPGMKLTVPPGSSYTGSPAPTGAAPSQALTIPPQWGGLGYGSHGGDWGIKPEQQVIYPKAEDYYGRQEFMAPQVIGK